MDARRPAWRQIFRVIVGHEWQLPNPDSKCQPMNSSRIVSLGGVLQRLSLRAREGAQRCHPLLSAALASTSSSASPAIRSLACALLSARAGPSLRSCSCLPVRSLTTDALPRPTEVGIPVVMDLGTDRVIRRIVQHARRQAYQQVIAAFETEFAPLLPGGVVGESGDAGGAAARAGGGGGGGAADYRYDDADGGLDGLFGSEDVIAGSDSVGGGGGGEGARGVGLVSRYFTQDELVGGGGVGGGSLGGLGGAGAGYPLVIGSAEAAVALASAYAEAHQSEKGAALLSAHLAFAVAQWVARMRQVPGSNILCAPIALASALTPGSPAQHQRASPALWLPARAPLTRELHRLCVGSQDEGLRGGGKGMGRGGGGNGRSNGRGRRGGAPPADDWEDAEGGAAAGAAGSEAARLSEEALLAAGTQRACADILIALAANAGMSY